MMTIEKDRAGSGTLRPADGTMAPGSRNRSGTFMALSQLVRASTPFALVPILWAAPLAPAAGQSVGIMPVGNSVTEGFGGQCSYREPLSQILSRLPGCDVEFLGPRFNLTPACLDAGTRHLGRSGFRADQVVDLGEFEARAARDRPDQVLLHIGSNDIAQGQSVESTVDEVDLLITQALQASPDATVLLAGIIPWDPTPRDAYTGPVFDREGVDELARSDELATELGALAARRIADGDAVRFVDMRPGFVNAEMTIDGVHPNELGERRMADAWLDALVAEGVCEDFALPTKTLESNQWYQIALPADPGDAATVADVFGDALPMADLDGYAGKWALVEYALDPDDPSGDAYAALSPTDRLAAGKGYWIIHAYDGTRTLGVPELSLPTRALVEPGCASGDGCVAIPLRADPNRDVRWNMIGNPFVGEPPFARARVATASGLCADGCDPDAADAANVVGNRLYHYEGGPGYEEVSPADRLSVWDGYWVPVLRGAAGLQPRYLATAR